MLQTLRAQGQRLRSIGKALGRNAASPSRELQRNRQCGKYEWKAAQQACVS